MLLSIKILSLLDGTSAISIQVKLGETLIIDDIG